MKVIHVRCENISLTMKTFHGWGEDKYIILYGVAERTTSTTFERISSLTGFMADKIRLLVLIFPNKMAGGCTIGSCYCSFKKSIMKTNNNANLNTRCSWFPEKKKMR